MLCLSGFELVFSLGAPVKIAEPRFETAAAHSTISEALSSGFSLFEEQEQAFVGVLPLPLIFDPPEDSKPIANKSNTHYSLAKSITGRIKFIKRTEL